MVKVSICIPAYNNEQSVRRLLESIEIQTYKDYEVIITDDSETGAVGRLAEEKNRDKSLAVKYFKNETQLGAAANWNQAIAKSSGEYVKIMHHDDWFTDENSLQAFVDMLEEHPEAGFAFSGTRQVGETAVYERFTAKEDIQLIREDYRNLFLGNTIGAPSAVIVRKSAIIYDKALTWLVDMEYYMQLLAENREFAYTEAPLISIGVGNGQLTEKCRDNSELNVSEYGYIYEKYKLNEVEKYRNKMMSVCSQKEKGLISKIEWKLTHLLSEKAACLLLLVLFAASLIPVLALSPVNQATGDDLGYGSRAHSAWLATHSIGAVAKAACETVEQYYSGWQGTWFSIFMFCFQPEVFSPKAYLIVPALMLALWIGSTALLSDYLLVKKAGYSKYSAGCLFLLFAAAGIQFVPSTKSAIFWYNGTAHYIIPYAIAVLAVYLFLHFMDTEKRAGLCYLGLFICMLLLGGVNYQAALMALILIVLSALFCYSRKKEKRRRLLACSLPLLAEMTGLIISMKSPGNKNRGGEDFGFSMAHAAETIASCFVKGMMQAGQYLTSHPLLLLIFIMAALAGAAALSAQKAKKRYPLPAVFVILSYCVYCASFAPELYAGVEVSGGVYNMNYYMFLFMIFADIIYLGGAAAERKAQDGNHRMAALFTLLGVCFFLFFGKDIKTTTSFQCIEYMASGQAEDFKNQMKLQKEILLDDSIRDVVLPQINDVQGPLMHMPLTSDTEAWTNKVNREFYGKDSIVALPVEEWKAWQEKADE